MRINMLNRLTPKLRQAGYGLIEAMIVAVCVAVGISAIYTFYQKVYATQEAHEESQNVAELTDRIMKAYGPMANFTGLSTTSIINEGVVPPSMGVSAGEIISSFGGDIVVASQTIDGIAGAGFRITYQDVPKEQCAKLAASVNQLNRYDSIIVSSAPSDGSDNSTGTVVAEDGKMNEATLATACNASVSPDVSFVYRKSENATAATSLELCTVPPAESEVVACASGYAGSISRTRTATCESPYGLPIWGAWTETSNTCAIICKPAPTSPETRSKTCPTGQIGSITEKRVSSCPSYTGSPTWSSWTVIANTCATPCVAPSPETRTLSCASGYLGSITEKRVATCPDPVGTPQWGAWTETNNTCAEECVLPSPSSQTVWRQTSEACPTGYSGNVYWDYEEKRVASCPQPTGSPVWSTYSPTGNTRNRDDSQCVSLCEPDSPLSRYVPVNVGCPTGYSGVHTYEAEETRTSVCTPGATSPTTSAWTKNGQKKNEVNTCAPLACDIAANTSRTWSTAAGSCTNKTATSMTLQSGQSLTLTDSAAPLTGTAKYTCSLGVLSTSADAGATCVASSCLVPASKAFSWNISGTSCNGVGPSTSSYISVGSSVSVNDAAGPTVGQAEFLCSAGGVLSTSASSGASCNVSCTLPSPSTETKYDNQKLYRNSYSCPSGYYGYYYQDLDQQRTSTRTAFCPASIGPYVWGEWSAWSAWGDVGGWSTVTNNCDACSPVYLDQYRWVDTTGTCPAGYTGTHTWQREQHRVRTASYSCPAGTATLPAPTYTYGTGYQDTGRIQNEVNTCAVTCVPPASYYEYRNQSETRSLSCPAYQTGSIGQARTNAERRLVSYTCPTQTGSPQASYGSWAVYDAGSWATTSNTCALPACGTTTETKANNYMSRYIDLYNAFGANYTAAYQHWYQTGYYEGRSSCWAGTCEVPNPSTERRPKPYTGNCSAGYYGTYSNWLTYEKRTWSCPDVVGSPVVSGWVWDGTPGTFVDNGDCKTCPATTTESDTQWAADYNVANCPSTYYGYKSYQREQERTRSKSYSCPAGTTSLPAPTYSAWTGWSNTGATKQVSSSCATCPANTSETNSHPTEYRSVAWCPAGQYGYHYQYRNVWDWRTKYYNCPAGTLNLPAPSYTAWTQASTAWATSSTDCKTCPANTTQYTYQWVGQWANCATGQYGVRTWEKQQQAGRSVSYSCPAGSTSAPAPSYGGWSGWSDTGATRSAVTTCATCPAATTESNSEWAGRSAACPSGQLGSHTWEEVRTQTRTKSYDCSPSPTSLPAPNYTGWSAWSWTGTKRNESNTCYTPAPCASAFKVYWTANGNTCGGAITSGVHGAVRSVYAQPAKMWDGDATFTCNNGTWTYNGDGWCYSAGGGIYP